MKPEVMGAYFQTLRKAARLTTTELAKLVDTSQSNISRIERGDQETRGSVLGNIISVLGARPDDVISIITNNNLTVDDAIRMANKWIEERKNNVTVSVHPEIVRIASQMTDYELGLWVRDGEKIINQRNT